MINLKPDKSRRIALIGLAIGSFMVGTRILYIFKESQKDDLIMNIIITGIGFIIAAVSLLYTFPIDGKPIRKN